MQLKAIMDKMEATFKELIEEEKKNPPTTPPVKEPPKPELTEAQKLDEEIKQLEQEVNSQDLETKRKKVEELRAKLNKQSPPDHTQNLVDLVLEG